MASISAEGIDQDDIVKTSDNSYTIKMPDTMNILKLKAIAESEFATVKIDNGEYLKVSAIYGANASGKI